MKPTDCRICVIKHIPEKADHKIACLKFSAFEIYNQIRGVGKSGNVLVIRALFGAGKVLCFGKKNLVPVPENGRSEKFIIWKQLHIFHDFKQRLRLTQATLAVFIRGFAVH
ncbi:MAG TPA: hypothetical protein DCE08_03620 [Ruminococcaceae bacterium]|nr:hypothetical protein [Oscillospiraceae bacterium]